MYSRVGIPSETGDCDRAHRHAVIVQNSLLAWHKAEVDEVGCRPDDIVCSNGLDKLVLQIGSQMRGHS